MKDHFKGNSIIYNFVSHKLWPKMLHLRVMDQDIIGLSNSQQKVIFFKRSVHEHGSLNEDETKISVCRTP